MLERGLPIGSEWHTTRRQYHARFAEFNAAEAYPAAQNDLGQRYEHGLDVEKDYSAGLNLYRLATQRKGTKP